MVKEVGQSLSMKMYSYDLPRVVCHRWYGKLLLIGTILRARPKCPSLIDTFAKANCAATSNRDFISGENTVNTNIKELFIKN